MAGLREAEEGIRQAHAALWAAAKYADNGVDKSVTDSLGRTFFGEMQSRSNRTWEPRRIGPLYPLPFHEGRYTKAAPWPQAGLEAVTYAEVGGLGTCFEVLDSIWPSSAHDKQAVALFFDPATASAALGALVVAPIQLWQAHREHQLTRLLALMESVDKAVAAEVAEVQQRRLNTLSKATKNEARDFESVSQAFLNNSYKLQAAPAKKWMALVQGNISDSSTNFVIGDTPSEKPLHAVGCHTLGSVLSVEALAKQPTDVRACGGATVVRVMFTTTGEVLLKPLSRIYSSDGYLAMLLGAQRKFSFTVNEQSPKSLGLGCQEWGLLDAADSTVWFFVPGL